MLFIEDIIIKSSLFFFIFILFIFIFFSISLSVFLYFSTIVGSDEDFFDKLVDNDFGPSKSGSKFNEPNEFDNAKALSNLSINDDASAFEDSGKRGASKVKIQKGDVDAATEDISSSLPLSTIGIDGTTKSNNDRAGSILFSDSRYGTFHGSRSMGNNRTYESQIVSSNEV